MKLLILFLFVQLVWCESKNDAASFTKFMVNNITYGVISSRSWMQPTYTFATVEPFVESSNGDLIFLMADISQTSQNLDSHPYGSFTIFQHNCSSNNYGGMPYNILACPRVTFMGKFVQNVASVNISDPDFILFSNRHPTATSWLRYPSHKFYLWRFVIEEIQYIGGYGHLHYIGPISKEYYQKAQQINPDVLNNSVGIGFLTKFWNFVVGMF